MNLSPIRYGARLEDYQKDARDLIRAFKSHDPKATYLIRRYHPKLPGRPDTNDRNKVNEAEVRRAGLSLTDAQNIIARAHDFESWAQLAKHITALNQKGSPVWQFETAVDAIVTGDAPTLRRLLHNNPELIRARSTRQHHATLLHYVGANAVEQYNQKTPKNAAQIARILLQAGAEVEADLGYGPEMRKKYPERMGSTTLGMVATSCHPAQAGVQIELLKILLDAGASINGVPGKWDTVNAALHNGRGHAAQFLARRGARLDLESAAGTGQLETVKSFFKKNGDLKPTATKKQLELGFMWACEYGHGRVVAFLLEKGVDVASMPHGETGLHWASYGGHANIVKQLLKRNPPLDIKDQRFDGTPLGWALYGWCEPAPEANRAGYYEVVARLVDAGATVDKDWLDDSDRGTPISKKVRADRKMRAAIKGKIP
jgi:ankyrin repeat protein